MDDSKVCNSSSGEYLQMYSSLSRRDEERSCCIHTETGGGPTFDGKS